MNQTIALVVATSVLLVGTVLASVTFLNQNQYLSSSTDNVQSRAECREKAVEFCNQRKDLEDFNNVGKCEEYIRNTPCFEETQELSETDIEQAVS